MPCNSSTLYCVNPPPLTRLDDDCSDRGIAPLRHELREHVDHRLAQIVVRRVRECGDVHGAASFSRPEIHRLTLRPWLPRTQGLTAGGLGASPVQVTAYPARASS